MPSRFVFLYVTLAVFRGIFPFWKPDLYLCVHININIYISHALRSLNDFWPQFRVYVQVVSWSRVEFVLWPCIVTSDLRNSAKGSRSLLLKVWPTAKQHGQHLGACEKCKISSPTWSFLIFKTIPRWFIDILTFEKLTLVYQTLPHTC